MQEDEFCVLVERLTGTPVKQITDTDRELLNKTLTNPDRQLDWNQFNELLLLVNKDRVGHPFFRRFFKDKCRVSDLKICVEDFQKTAMLRYGNFVFAFRTLSRIDDEVAFAGELGHLCTDGNPLSDLRARSDKVLEIEKIARDDTALVGYLSTEGLAKDIERCTLLEIAFDQLQSHDGWDSLQSTVERLSKPPLRKQVFGLMARFRGLAPGASVNDFNQHLATLKPVLSEREKKMIDVQQVATRNQDIYLTWDHMDVYFATSMRKAWEFADLYDFVNALMTSEELADLKVSYFDPTQSYTPERVDKGLVESLMLKRAQCTIYSVQDTDTLGKDSELAATLAQGKPVIAYIPSINEDKRVAELLKEEPAAILDRLRFVAYADGQFFEELAEQDRDFVEEFRALPDFTKKTLLLSFPDLVQVSKFKEDFRQQLSQLSRIIASSEKRLYDKRANTLKSSHPLGLQVNLHTGVANGVLVVRTVSECAEVLRRILTHSVEFILADDKGHWSLRESISGSIFRVVTKNAKLNNCFWNFYLRS